MTSEELASVIEGCRSNNAENQKQLYHFFYNYGMTVCSRYARNEEEAREMLNDAFLKVFIKIDKYSPHLSFKAWLNKILVNTAIDYYRRSVNQPTVVDLVHVQYYQIDADAIVQLSVKEMLKMVQDLPPSYRMVFNLHVIEGYKHPEIAEKLGITIGASKSNLAKARMKLRTMIQKKEGKISKHA